MCEDFPPDLKPNFSLNLGANSPTAVPSAPIIIDSDSSSDFSPLEEICLDDVEREISLELGDSVSSPAITSSHTASEIVSPLFATAPDTTERNPDKIQLSSDEESVAQPCPHLPIVSQTTSSTQTRDFEFSNTFQKRATKSAPKFTPYSATRRNWAAKNLKNKIKGNSGSATNLKRGDIATQSDVPLGYPPSPLIPPLVSLPNSVPPMMPLPNNMPPFVPPQNALPPIFTPNYAMAAAATLSAAAFLQPFLQMQPPGFLDMMRQISATPAPFVPPQTQTTDTDTNLAPSEVLPKPQLAEGPSSTSDTFGNETSHPDTFPHHSQKAFRKTRPNPTIKWRNSAQFREADSAEVFEPQNDTSPATSTPSNPLPSFHLTHLRSQSADTLEAYETPDTTIPTFKTSSYQEPLFKLPSSPTSATSETSPDNSLDDRFVTYDANPTVAGGRCVVEFTDLAPSTNSATIEELAGSIGPVENFEFHQGLLFSRATVAYFIPKHALQCRRKFHMLCLEGVHISCHFADADMSPVLKFPD